MYGWLREKIPLLYEYTQTKEIMDQVCVYQVVAQTETHPYVSYNRESNVTLRFNVNCKLFS